MKICKLFIQNINSLKGQFTIDFEAEPLKDSGLFAITGPTGAGKSTILDAISLSLFGRSPRLGAVTKTTISASGALMSFGTKETIAELERIGDVADKICRTALEKFSQQHQPLLVSLESLGRHTIQMLHDVLDAFARMDIDEAVRIYREDKKV
ncbi:hypothetical protein EB093_09505, partial [bacterium]|nr:hypothetical protein [bacterium]